MIQILSYNVWTKFVLEYGTYLWSQEKSVKIYIMMIFIYFLLFSLAKTKSKEIWAFDWAFFWFWLSKKLEFLSSRSVLFEFGKIIDSLFYTFCFLHVKITQMSFGAFGLYINIRQVRPHFLSVYTIYSIHFKYRHFQSWCSQIEKFKFRPSNFF
jgi:hypothetical protein